MKNPPWIFLEVCIEGFPMVGYSAEDIEEVTMPNGVSLHTEIILKNGEHIQTTSPVLVRSVLRWPEKKVTHIQGEKDVIENRKQGRGL